ncbi:MAG: pyridoxamine 5'-phosphate oxidase [Candidatus Poseidoniia archaeon]|jgi:pyridoxamine 5'-phosphate oxidase|nr:pyridoxamine 5'-phosphate oxidase [Candidatus Poseidoniia archaeon]|tara:strand:+ start:772 stop:1410 length:639 start_codon:yes stop_codon:yes gene_type:complete
MVSLEEMRKQYDIAELNQNDLLESPTDMFRNWFEKIEDLEHIEPNAAILSTSTKKGKPSSRAVLVKEFDERGFVFYTNYKSKKAQEIEVNPYGSLLFYWQDFERQVRIQGKIRKVSRSKSEKYFHSRPRLSQISVLASHQSKTLENREELDKKVKKLEKMYDGKEIPLPDYWGGYILEHRNVEFWQGRRDRLHDRFVYTKHGRIWQIERLAP